MNQTFVVRLRGSSHENVDGTSRQELIAQCKKGDILTLKAEPENTHDRHAVAVLNSNGKQIGYLPSDARDSSSILRGEPISAVVLKRIGGPKWWHGFFGTKRNWGLLITLSKGQINWDLHNRYRKKAEIVDKLVKDAMSLEKSGENIEKVVASYIAAMNAVNELNTIDPVAAAHRYAQAPINRLTMILVKAKKPDEAKQAYKDWTKVTDPIGLTKGDSESLQKRMVKINAI